MNTCIRVIIEPKPVLYRAKICHNLDNHSDLFYLRILHLLLIIFCSGMQSFYFSESQDAIVLQICHEKWCSRPIRLQFHDSLIWETASPRTHKPKIVNEPLQPSFKTEIKSTLDWSSGIRLISAVNIISG